MNIGSSADVHRAAPSARAVPHATATTSMPTPTTAAAAVQPPPSALAPASPYYCPPPSQWIAPPPLSSSVFPAKPDPCDPCGSTKGRKPSHKPSPRNPVTLSIYSGSSTLAGQYPSANVSPDGSLIYYVGLGTRDTALRPAAYLLRNTQPTPTAIAVVPADSDGSFAYVTGGAAASDFSRFSVIESEATTQSIRIKILAGPTLALVAQTTFSDFPDYGTASGGTFSPDGTLVALEYTPLALNPSSSSPIVSYVYVLDSSTLAIVAGPLTVEGYSLLPLLFQLRGGFYGAEAPADSATTKSSRKHKTHGNDGNNCSPPPPPPPLPRTFLFVSNGPAVIPDSTTGLLFSAPQYADVYEVIRAPPGISGTFALRARAPQPTFAQMLIVDKANTNEWCFASSVILASGTLRSVFSGSAVEVPTATNALAMLGLDTREWRMFRFCETDGACGTPVPLRLINARNKGSNGTYGALSTSLPVPLILASWVTRGALGILEIDRLIRRRPTCDDGRSSDNSGSDNSGSDSEDSDKCKRNKHHRKHRNGKHRAQTQSTGPSVEVVSGDEGLCVERDIDGKVVTLDNLDINRIIVTDSVDVTACATQSLLCGPPGERVPATAWAVVTTDATNTPLFNRLIVYQIDF